MKQAKWSFESSFTTSDNKYEKKRHSDAKKRHFHQGLVIGAATIIVVFVSWARTRLLHWKEDDVFATNNDSHVIPRVPLPIRIIPSQQQQQQQAVLVVPNLLLVGAQKAGTTAVADWLFQNGVCRPKVIGNEPSLPFSKEVHFFDNPQRLQQGLDFYAKRFEDCQNATLTLDATPDYLDLALPIHSFYKNISSPEDAVQRVKMLVVLREPISRELSSYNHQRKLYLQDPDPNQWYSMIAAGEDDNNQPMSFEEHVQKHLLPCLNKNKQLRKNQGVILYPCETIAGRYYAKHLRGWLKVFDRQQILILSHDELQQDPTMALTRISKFLFATMDVSKLARKNTQSQTDKVQRPSCKLQAQLDRLFAPWNEELYKLLESHPGPAMEETPFRKFQLGDCE